MIKEEILEAMYKWECLYRVCVTQIVDTDCGHRLRQRPGCTENAQQHTHMGGIGMYIVIWQKRGA